MEHDKFIFLAGCLRRSGWWGPDAGDAWAGQNHSIFPVVTGSAGMTWPVPASAVKDGRVVSTPSRLRSRLFEGPLPGGSDIGLYVYRNYGCDSHGSDSGCRRYGLPDVL